MCSSKSVSADGREIDRLGQEITELASHIHAATCRWLGMVAEFDRRGGWGRWGCKSCAHFISWRCAIAPRAARDHVRVARRLEELPLVRAAFAEGRLSYSKVRALVRVENVEREEDLLSLARHATAAQLENLVRAYRGIVGRDRVAAGGGPERYVTWSHDDDGSVLLRARLPAEEGEIFLAALEAAERASAPVESEGGSAEPPRLRSERRTDALVLMADTALANGPSARGGDRYQVVLHVDRGTLATDGEGDRCELADGAPLAPETARRLACDAAIVPLIERNGRPLSVGRKTRSVPPALRRALASRDRGCRFPGCANRCSVDAHHIRHWADGGPTSIDNLVQLCRHHHGLLHEGGYTVERIGSRFVFRRPDGREIRAVPRPPRGRTAMLREANRRWGGPVQSDACVPESYERMDLGLCVDAMLRIAPLEGPGI
jgi:Domain of unknown function (DUF222)/HNH endonuclease